MLEFLLNSLWLLERTLSAQMRNFPLNYICIFIDTCVYVLECLR